MTKNLFLSSVLFCSALSLSACKIKQNVLDEANIPVSVIGNIQAAGPRNFSASELEIGKRICSNLKYKREFFETLNNDKEQFRFKAELRNCDNGLYNNAFFVANISNANSTEPEYIANRETYFKDVVTDQSGIMKTVCLSLNQSDVVANNVLSGNYKYMIGFLIADGFDTYQVTKARKNVNGQYETLFGESVALISNKNQAAAKFIGVEKDRIRYSACDGKKYSTLRQTWIEAVTPF